MYLCVFVCMCVWELNHIYLPVAKAISLQVTIRLIGVVKDRTLHSKDKVMTNYFLPIAPCIVEIIKSCKIFLKCSITQYLTKQIFSLRIDVNCLCESVP